MKTRIFLLTLAAFNCMAVRAQIIKIGGSTTLQDAFKSAAEDFKKTHSNNQFIIDEKGSKIGIDSLYENKVDIALTSRPLESGEREKFNSKDSLIEKIIAYDGLMIIVNPQTGIKQLTKDQVGEIFRGKIDNWKVVGGNDIPIRLISRDQFSGTYEYFKVHVMDNCLVSSGALISETSDELLKDVERIKGAIGYIGGYQKTEKVQNVAISVDEGKTFVEPTTENIAGKKYPFIRPLYMLYYKASSAKLNEFISYLYSKKGRSLFIKYGFFDIPALSSL